MKLQELAVANPTKQVAKVFESYFGDRLAFDNNSRAQSRGMLRRVRGLIAEHRRTSQIHHSEQNPAYLKLVMMEQALSAVAVREDVPPATATAPTSQPAVQASTAQTSGMQAAQVQQKKKQIQDAIKMKQAEIAQLQKQMNDPTMLAMSESRRQRRLREASELQQAQVVLASQDMVDQVQKMIEQVSSMQFKDLPALVDQIKNEIGINQSTQFNTDANAALSGLVQNLQGSKQQLETALGVVTGQAPTVPGADMTAGADMNAGAEMPNTMPGPDLEAPEEEPVDVGLGRERR
jgi:hypothetical protein